MHRKSGRVSCRLPSIVRYVAGIHADVVNSPWFSLKYVPDFFPGAGFKKAARDWRKTVSAMPEVPYNFVKKSLVCRFASLSFRGLLCQSEGTAKSSIASRVLEEIEEAPGADDQEEVLKDILGACYGALCHILSPPTTHPLTLIY
jgi:hypothetical protein